MPEQTATFTCVRESDVAAAQAAQAAADRYLNSVLQLGACLGHWSVCVQSRQGEWVGEVGIVYRNEEGESICAPM